MSNDKLYKYLDASGGLAMLYNSTLMFTNATQLNDPFDCHPAYIHFSGDMPTPYKGWPPETVSELEYNKGLQRRDKTYICSLSKVYDSILMWSYYNKHQGICIGLDMNKTRKYLNRMMSLFFGCQEIEVVYRDVVNDPAPMNEPIVLFRYHFATKAKDWQHEQEVRLISYDPLSEHMRLLPGQYEEDPSFCTKLTRIFQKKKEESYMDWKEVRAFLDIGGECFESVYLGVNINKKNEETKEKIIEAARKCNPDIKIYQMEINSKAFRLTEKLID